MKFWTWGSRPRRVRRSRRQNTVSAASRALYAEHKEAARALVERKIGYFSRHYQFPVGKVSIRNQRSRWGSCSKQGNLNFTYKILFIPDALADYLIVHELCHLKEFNHSAQFWALVAETIPDWKERRRALKRVKLSDFPPVSSTRYTHQ